MFLGQPESGHGINSRLILMKIYTQQAAKKLPQLQINTSAGVGFSMYAFIRGRSQISVYHLNDLSRK